MSLFTRILEGVARFLGQTNKATLEQLRRQVAQINQAQQELAALSDDDFRATSLQLRQTIRQEMEPWRSTLAAMRQAIVESPTLPEKMERLEALQSKQKAYRAALEKVLSAHLPLAFALVKETARRFKEQQGICVTATPYDEQIAQKVSYVEVKEGKAYWKNTWEAEGQPIVWDIVHYDVQLMGGIVLHEGKIAEMATGEGKTLAATAPAFLNALGGEGVHIITVNDYLAKRDAAWMAPLYQFHQLTVDCIDRYQPQTPERRQAYLADITFGTNYEFGFDYLRDNTAVTQQQKVQRPENSHHYAIVDEADFVCIDDARTPLIISGPSSEDDSDLYAQLNPYVQELYLAQKRIAAQLLTEAKAAMADTEAGDKKAKEKAGNALLRLYRGLPKYQPFIQYLSEKGIKQLLSAAESDHLLEQAMQQAPVEDTLLFIINEQNNSVELTDKGIEHLTQRGTDPQFFVLPDIGMAIAQIENDPTLNDSQKIEARNALQADYATKSARLHVVAQLLKAYTMYVKNVDYVVANQKVYIVDEKTGRILAGRRYSQGLHQALEAKENVPIEHPSQTYAVITPQNQFRMYHKLAGMTGTAETEAVELWDIYKLRVVKIPTHLPMIREDRHDKVFRTQEEKLQAIKEEVQALRAQNRPVLVGTSSVESSEIMRNILGLPQEKVLNAKNHRNESRIIQDAGKAGQVTIVTHMGGRGTDIKLDEAARALGGLAIIGSERHESRRVDRQLRGRAGRQGDPGSSQFFVSLEDPLMAHFRHGFIGRQMDRAFTQPGEAIQDPLITSALEKAQKRIEQDHFSSRRRLLEYDDVMNLQRAVIYSKRNHALDFDLLELDFLQMVHFVIKDIVDDAQTQHSFQTLQRELLACFGLQTTLTETQFAHGSNVALIKQIYHEVLAAYHARQQDLATYFSPVLPAIIGLRTSLLPLPWSTGSRGLLLQLHLPALDALTPEMCVAAVKSAILLYFIDDRWKHHLLHMDQLRDIVRNAAYEQKDPLLVYKAQALEMFKQLMGTINRSVLTAFFTGMPDTPKLSAADQIAMQSFYRLAREGRFADDPASPAEPNQPVVEHQPSTNGPAIGRNERMRVRYADGRILDGVKYKTVEKDLKAGLCEIIPTA